MNKKNMFIPFLFFIVIAKQIFL